MARRSKEEAEQTRQALLSTALAEFSDKGIGQISLKQLSVEAGMTHGALYWHFRNRQDLLETLYHEHLFPFDLHYLEQRQAARQDALGALQGLLADVLKDVERKDEYRHYYKVFFYHPEQQPELLPLLPRLTERREEWIAKIAYFLRQARKQDQIQLKKTKVEMIARSIFSMFSGLLESWLRQPLTASLQQQGNETFRIFLSGLRS